MKKLSKEAVFKLLRVGMPVTTNTPAKAYYHGNSDPVYFEPGIIGFVRTTRIPAVYYRRVLDPKTGKLKTTKEDELAVIDFARDGGVYRCALWPNQIVFLDEGQLKLAEYAREVQTSWENTEKDKR